MLDRNGEHSRPGGERAKVSGKYNRHLTTQLRPSTIERLTEMRRVSRAAGDTPSLVRALFKDAAVAFNLPKQTSLEYLAQKLAQLGQRYGGRLLYVDIRRRG